MAFRSEFEHERYYASKKYLDQFLESFWDKDESIGIERAFSSKGNDNGRSIFFNDQLIHAYKYF